LSPLAVVTVEVSAAAMLDPRFERRQETDAVNNGAAHAAEKRKSHATECAGPSYCWRATYHCCVDIDLLRANELIVYRCDELAYALRQFQHVTPDVVVAVLPGHDSASIVTPLARHWSTTPASIIVASVLEEREAARKAGADSFPP
jgi:hypothetical protein